MKESSEVLVLASGGIDSTALIDFYLRRNVQVRCAHFQHGQQNGQSEKEAVERICEHFGVERSIINLGFSISRQKEEFLCRNVIFVLVASSVEPLPKRIALGIHLGSLYYDCSRIFLGDCQRILDGYFSGRVRVEAPFIDLGKIDIVEYCRMHHVPLHLTYSCQKQSYPPCGKCTSCLDREKLLGY